jgi:hypothetical protein
VTDIERIEPARPVSWPRVVARHPSEDETDERHQPQDDEPAEERDDLPPDDRGHPRIDVRV